MAIEIHLPDPGREGDAEKVPSFPSPVSRQHYARVENHYDFSVRMRLHYDPMHGKFNEFIIPAEDVAPIHLGQRAEIYMVGFKALPRPRKGLMRFER